MIPRESIEMFTRRSAMVGGLAMAAVPSLTGVALAQAGKATLVFMGHEL
jgi:hypothetical protein